MYIVLSMSIFYIFNVYNVRRHLECWLKRIFTLAIILLLVLRMGRVVFFFQSIKTIKTGWTVSPEFTIHLHGRDIQKQL